MSNAHAVFVNLKSTALLMTRVNRYGWFNISAERSNQVLRACARGVVVKLASVLSAAAISLLATFNATSQDDGVTVFAAASLTGALDEVATAFESYRGSRVTISYAGTASLARQIEQGAPADIFISADVTWMDYLSELRLINESRRVDLLGNRLVLVAPATVEIDDTTDISALLLEYVGAGRPLAMANVDAVPAGRYGKAALQSLGVWEAMAPFVVQADSVRTALAFVARAEAPFGIVYATDAAANPDVVVVGAFDEGLHLPIVYPAALLEGISSANALAFFAFLTGAEAGAIFREHGFVALVLAEE